MGILIRPISTRYVQKRAVPQRLKSICISNSIVPLKSKYFVAQEVTTPSGTVDTRPKMHIDYMIGQ